jgi:hypothetical protein
MRSAEAAQTEDAATRINPEHFIERGGLRFVLPYFFDFKMHAKKRMAGRHPVELFSAEFPVRDRCAGQRLGNSCVCAAPALQRGL